MRLGVAEAIGSEAQARRGDEVKNTQVLETPQNFEEAMEKIKEVLPSLTQGQKVEAGAIGIRGVLNKSKTLLEKDDVLPLWLNQPIKESLQEMTSAPFFLENDAALNGLGEAVYGAGKDKQIVAFLTISTGVGGSRVVNGRLDENALGFEPGKQIVDAERKITLENLISGRALEQKYGKKAEDISDPEVWEEVALNLAVGLNNLAVLWSPEVIVLGGSVTRSIPIESVERYLKEILTVYPTVPEVKKADLGDLSGLYGALALLNQKSY